MTKKRVPHSEPFKVKVVLEALKGLKSQQQIAAEFGIHPVQVTQWKTQFLEAAPSVFFKAKAKKDSEEDVEKAQLYEKIGRLEMENDWLKKKLER
jgi:transposase-like protein